MKTKIISAYILISLITISSIIAQNETQKSNEAEKASPKNIFTTNITAPFAYWKSAYSLTYERVLKARVSMIGVYTIFDESLHGKYFNGTGRRQYYESGMKLEIGPKFYFNTNNNLFRGTYFSPLLNCSYEKSEYENYKNSGFRTLSTGKFAGLTLMTGKQIITKRNIAFDVFAKGSLAWTGHYQEILINTSTSEEIRTLYLSSNTFNISLSAGINIGFGK